MSARSASRNGRLLGGGGVSLTELLTLRSKKDLNEYRCAGKQQIDVYRFGSVTTPCPWPAPRAAHPARAIEVRCVFHVVSNVGRAAPRRGALRRCWKLYTNRTTDVVPEFCKAPLKYSDGAVDGGHYYYYALYLGIIGNLFASHRTSLVRHRSHAEGSQRGRQSARKKSSAQARKTSSARSPSQPCRKAARSLHQSRSSQLQLYLQVQV